MTLNLVSFFHFIPIIPIFLQQDGAIIYDWITASKKAIKLRWIARPISLVNIFIVKSVRHVSFGLATDEINEGK